LIAAANYAAYIYDTQAAGEGAPEEDLMAWFASAKDAGTGPYTIESWEDGAEFELTLTAYPEYWGGWDGDHYTEVVYRYVPEPTTAAQLVQSGEVSYVDRLTPQLVDSLRGDDRVQVVETPSFQNVVVLLNTASGPLGDPALRGAVAKSVDPVGIATALGGSVVATKGVIPPGLLGYSDALTGTGLDLDDARQLLADTGYGPDGAPLTLVATIVADDPDLQLITTSLNSNLAQLGIDLDVQGMSWQAQWDKARSENVEDRQDVFIMYWWPDYPDPFSWFISLFRTEEQPNFNLAYYSDGEMDAKIDGIQALEATDRAAAEQQYVEMQQQLIDDAVVVAPYVQNYQRVLDATVGGFVDDPAYAQVVFVYDLTPGA
jgi:peptide/nickel transport system substrate-binding protein